LSNESAQELNDERLMAYVDGELSDAERMKIEEALGIDHDFRAELEELSRAGHLVDDVLKNIMREVQAESHRQEALPSRPKLAALAQPTSSDSGKRAPEKIVDGLLHSVEHEADESSKPDDRPRSSGWRKLWIVILLGAAIYGGYLYSQLQ